MCIEKPGFFARLSVPKAKFFVPATRGQLTPIGTEGGGDDRVSMAERFGEGHPGSDVPDSGRLVFGNRDQAQAIGTEGRGTASARDDQAWDQPLSGCDIPKVCVSFLAATRFVSAQKEEPRVGAENHDGN